MVTRADPYEPYLHRRLLGDGQALVDLAPALPDDAPEIARRLFDLRCTTPVPALAEATGRLLRALLPTALRPQLLSWAHEAVAAERSVARLGLFACDGSFRDRLLAILTEAPTRPVALAAVTALGDVVADDMVLDALLAYLPILMKEVDLGPWLPTWLRVVGSCSPWLPTWVRAVGSRVADPRVYAALYEMLAWGGEGWVACHAARDVFRAHLADPPVRAALLTPLSAPDPTVVHKAIHKLHWFSADPAVADALLPLLADPNWQLAALPSLLAGLTLPPVRDAVLPLLPRRGPHYNWYDIPLDAARDPQIQRALVALLADIETLDRFWPHRLLQQVVVEPDVRDILLTLTWDERLQVRQAAIQALASSAHDPQVRAVLLAHLHNPEPQVRCVVPLGLEGVARESDVVAAMCACLDDPHYLVQINASQTLAHAAADPAVRRDLIAYMDTQKRPNSPGRVWVPVWAPLFARALGPVAAEPGMPELLACLVDEGTVKTRAAAAEALRDTPPTPALREILGRIVTTIPDRDRARGHNPHLSLFEEYLDGLPPDYEAAYCTLTAWAEREYPLP